MDRDFKFTLAHIICLLKSWHISCSIVGSYLIIVKILLEEVLFTFNSRGAMFARRSVGALDIRSRLDL